MLFELELEMLSTLPLPPVVRHLDTSSCDSGLQLSDHMRSLGPIHSILLFVYSFISFFPYKLFQRKYMHSMGIRTSHAVFPGGWSRCEILLYTLKTESFEQICETG